MFVLAGLGAGGAERVVSLLSGEMIERGHDVSVVAFDGPKDPIYHSFQSQVEIVRLSIPAGGKSFLRGIEASVRRVTELRRLFKRSAPDVVISFLTKVNVISVLASTGLHIPVIISERNNPAAQRAHPFWAFAWKIAARRASAIVLQTEAIRVLYPQSIQLRAVVIPNPVLPPIVNREPHDGLMLTAVGRLEWQKGFDTLIKAFAAIAEDFPDWKLVIWGDGPERSRLQWFAEQSGRPGQIELAGKSQSPGDWIKNADLFVLSSRYEGFPNVLVEAMAAGIPALSFRCNFGPEEIIDDGNDGVLVEAENIVMLTAELRSLMQNEQFRQRVGAAAAASMARYGVSEVVSKWEALLKKRFTPTENSD